MKWRNWFKPVTLFAISFLKRWSPKPIHRWFWDKIQEVCPFRCFNPTAIGDAPYTYTADISKVLKWLHRINNKETTFAFYRNKKNKTTKQAHCLERKQFTYVLICTIVTGLCNPVLRFKTMPRCCFKRFKEGSNCSDFKWNTQAAYVISNTN